MLIITVRHRPLAVQLVSVVDQFSLLTPKLTDRTDRALYEYTVHVHIIQSNLVIIARSGMFFVMYRQDDRPTKAWFSYS